jgi:hypothetical protein
MKAKFFIATIALAAGALMAGNKEYKGGELFTQQEYKYGKFEARMKMAAASGTVSSMFLYQNGSEIADGRPWVEVDIEVLGKQPNSFQSNIITGKAGAQITSEKFHDVNPAADQDFHTYAIEWTPNYVRWTVDGVEVRKTVGGQVSNLTGTQGLRFNLWSSTNESWVDPFDPSKLPLYQFINWVKVYEYKPGQGDNGSDFKLQWTDDFKTFDANRWSKGDWTFDGNRVDISPSNIYAKDGMVIIALTKKGQESFNGQVPQDPEGDAMLNGSSQQSSSSSSEQYNPPSSSSQENNPFVSSSSSADPTGILPTRVKLQNKDIRGTVNAKGARVNPNNKANYQVDFNF